MVGGDMRSVARSANERWMTTPWIARRDANQVWVQLEFGLVATDSESRALDHG